MNGNIKKETGEDLVPYIGALSKTGHKIILNVLNNIPSKLKEINQYQVKIKTTTVYLASNFSFFTCSSFFFLLLVSVGEVRLLWVTWDVHTCCMSISLPDNLSMMVDMYSLFFSKIDNHFTQGSESK